MLIGSLLGIQLGALTTKVIKGIYIRAFYAIAILAGFANRLFALPSKLDELEVISISDTTSRILSFIGNLAFFIAIGIFSLWVIGKFLANIKTLRGED
jgi:hypothetical protein